MYRGTIDEAESPSAKKPRLMVNDVMETKDETAYLVKRASKMLKVNPVFLCPISHEIMSDPVILSGGHTFDRCNIEEWLKKHDTCPITRTPIADRRLIINQSIKSQILEYKEKLVRKCMSVCVPLLQDGGDAAIATRLLERAHTYSPNDRNIRISLIEGLLKIDDVSGAIKQTHSLLGLLDGDHEGSVQALLSVLRTSVGHLLIENLESLSLDFSKCRHYVSHFKVMRDAMLELQKNRVAATVVTVLANLMERHDEDEEEIVQLLLEATRLDPENTEILSKVEQYMTKHNRLSELLMLTFRKAKSPTDDRIQSFFTTVCNIVQQQKKEIAQLKYDMKTISVENERMGKHLPAYTMGKKLREFGADLLQNVRLITPVPLLQCRMVLTPSIGAKSFHVAHLCRSIVASTHAEGHIAVWNIETGQQFTTVNACNGHDVLEVAPLGDDIIVALSNGVYGASLQVVNWRTDHIINTIQCSAKVQVNGHNKMTCFGCDDGSYAYAIVGHANGAIIAYDLSKRGGEVVKSLRGHETEVTCVEPLTDGRLASASEDNTIRIWNVEEGECEAILQGHTSAVTCLRLVSDNILASGGSDALRLWSVHTGTCVKTLVGHTAAITQIAILGRDLIASASEDGGIRMWNTEDGKCLWTMSHPEKVISLCAIKSTVVSVVEKENKVRVWSA